MHVSRNELKGRSVHRWTDVSSYRSSGRTAVRVSSHSALVRFERDAERDERRGRPERADPKMASLRSQPLAAARNSSISSTRLRLPSHANHQRFKSPEGQQMLAGGCAPPRRAAPHRVAVRRTFPAEPVASSRRGNVARQTGLRPGRHARSRLRALVRANRSQRRRASALLLLPSSSSPHRHDLLTDPLFKNARQRRAACRNRGLRCCCFARRYARPIQGRLRCATGVAYLCACFTRVALALTRDCRSP